MMKYKLLKKEKSAVIFSAVDVKQNKESGSGNDCALQPDVMLRIEVLCSRLLRVTETIFDAFTLQDEPMIINSAPDIPATSDAPDSANWSLAESDSGYVLSTDSLRVRLSYGGALRYETATGEGLTREPDRYGRTLREIDIVRNKFDPDAPVETVNSVDGIRQRAKGEPYVDRKGVQTKLSFVFDPDEAIYGLGQHEEGILNYRGAHQFLYQHNLKIACPVIMSSRGWGVLYNSCSAMTFHDDAMGSYLSSDADAEMDFFFLYGPEFDDMIAHIRRLTGDAAMLPKWAFGYIQSKERYCNQDELLEVSRKYREHNIPLDCIVQDWQTWKEGLWGNKVLDETRYPDLKACTDKLHDIGVKLMFSIWPHMQGEGENRLEFKEKGLLLGNRSTYDAFSEKAREVYWRQTNEGLFSKGVDAWWCDCSEPFEADWYGGEAMIPENRMQLNVNEFKTYLDPTMINVYSLVHSRGIWDGQRSTDMSKRVFNMTRSGYPGQQRYGAVAWNGDVSATWEILRRSIPDGLNFCLSGQPYWNFDIGAFFSGVWDNCWFARGEYDGGCEDPAYRELYLRWLQVGAFLPLMRSHGTSTPREVWCFGEKGEVIYDAIVDAINLRMKLLPYIYSVSAAVTLERSTMLRMLAFDFRDDKNIRNIKDQFMFGKNIMVCPALYPGMTERDVYLPQGADWFDFYTGERFKGGQTIKTDAGPGKIPLFVPAGSIIPIGPVRQHAGDMPDAPITLRVFGGADGMFRLYEDEGDGYGYENGAYAIREICWNESARELTIGAAQGDYPGMPETCRFLAVYDGKEQTTETESKQEEVLNF